MTRLAYGTPNPFTVCAHHARRKYTIISESILTDSNKYLTCPFCGESCILPKPGKVRCPICFSKFEVDDRLECMFADTNSQASGKGHCTCHLRPYSDQGHQELSVLWNSDR